MPRRPRIHLDGVPLHEIKGVRLDLFPAVIWSHGMPRRRIHLDVVAAVEAANGSGRPRSNARICGSLDKRLVAGSQW